MIDLEKIEEIYHAALEKTPAERAAFLRESCGGDERLQREVESLLSFDERAQSFIESPPDDLAAVVVNSRKIKNRVGKKLNHYRVVSLLGTGGMGDVYLAEDTRLDRLVALKLLPPQFAEDKARMDRFVREAKTASALNHPNIITIHEIGESGSTRFIAAEYIEGETLHSHLKRRLDVQTVLDIAVQIASALDKAHRAGIIHRDIKPENIMVRPDGLVKVLDFGIAKLSEPLELSGIARSRTTNPGMVVGTANYMSPEQAKGQLIDERSDIFSFGIVLYEMLAGKRPFDGEAPLEIMSSILKDEPAPLGQLSVNAPREVEQIVRKALCKNRDERYQTAGDLLADLKSVRRDLDFLEKLEQGDVPPAVRSSLTTGETKPTMSGAQVITAEFKKHKFGFAAVSLVLLMLAGVGVWFFPGKAGDDAPLDSIAVLPFQNASRDREAEFLSDGLSETLINNFTKIPLLRVTARSTAFRYRGRDGEPQTIGKELGVRAILTGKISQRGDSVSIQVDLINAGDGTQIWGNQYNGTTTAILSIQQEIARDVSGRLKPELSVAEKQLLAKNYTQSGAAYEFYLRGRYHWNKRTAEGLKTAIQEFKQAAELDPNYALALVGLADCYLLLEEYTGASPAKTLPQARAFATRALEIDDSLGEAHVSLGVINSQMWQWAEAENHFKQAIRLDPKYSTAYLWFCTYLRDTGRLKESLAAIKQAQTLDPLSSIINVNVGIMYLVNDDANRAVEELEKVIELDPNYWTAHSWLGLAYLKQNRSADALAALQKGVELSRSANRSLAFFGYAKAATGNRSEAIAIVQDLEEKLTRNEATMINIATVYAGLGDKDQAFAWLEKNFEPRSGESARFRWQPAFDSLRGDPRYQSLLKRMEQKTE